MIFNTFQRSISVYGTTCDSSYIWMLVVAIVLTPGGPWPVGLHYKQELIWSIPTRRTLLFRTEYCVAFFPLLDYREFQCDPFINWDAKVTLSPIFATEWAFFFFLFASFYCYSSNVRCIWSHLSVIFFFFFGLCSVFPLRSVSCSWLCLQREISDKFRAETMFRPPTPSRFFF